MGHGRAPGSLAWRQEEVGEIGMAEGADSPTDARRLAAAVDILAANRLSPGPLGALPRQCRPVDESDAYTVQHLLHARLSTGGLGPVVGRKIGCTTPVMQRFLGIGSPCAGAVFAATVQHGRGRFRHAAFNHVGVECEIAVRLDADLPPAGAPYDRSTVGRAVGACLAAIEVVDDRYQDYRSIGTPTLIADDFFNAGCVLGSPVEAGSDIDLAVLRGRMTINGVPVGAGIGADILGHPLDALAWLAGHAAAVGRGLTAGSFVLLGSLVQTRWVEAGDLVEIEIDRLGVARAEFA